MKQFIGCDSHARYSVFVSIDEQGRVGPAVRVEHGSRELRDYLATLAAGTPVAVEASGGWYWFFDELEAAGMDARLVNPLEAKRRMGGKNKTDKLDAKGLAILLRNGTLPEVWVPPEGLRDLRGLMRARLSLRSQTTVLKNRMHAAIRRYGTLRGEPRSDLFTAKSWPKLALAMGRLPDETRAATWHECELLREMERHLGEMEIRIGARIGSIGWVRLLKSLPGVGEILGATIYLEIGDVRRFPTAEHLASYAGLVPTVHASGGKSHHGPTSKQANHYLRWAFVEAAACIVSHKQQRQGQHVVELYERLKKQKGHGKAAVAVARHLAEASWWMLSKKEAYRAPQRQAMSSSKNG
ncbi:MAG TPA: IS110 family transposase [Terracidiphilus sp.]